MQTKDVSWLAGLLEGEAHFGAGRKKIGTGTPFVTLTMTDEDVVSRAAGVLGGCRVLTYPAKQDGWKRVYCINVCGNRAASWMMTLYPLLGVRRQRQIREALTLWRATPPANGKKTHCPRGHAYDEQNTELERRGDKYVLRHCRACKNERRRKVQV